MSKFVVASVGIFIVPAVELFDASNTFPASPATKVYAFDENVGVAVPCVIVGVVKVLLVRV